LFVAVLITSKLLWIVRTC